MSGQKCHHCGKPIARDFGPNGVWYHKDSHSIHCYISTVAKPEEE